MSKIKCGKGESGKKIDIDRLLTVVDRLKTVHWIRYHSIDAGGQLLIEKLLEGFKNPKKTGEPEDLERSLFEAVATAIDRRVQPGEIVNTIVASADNEIEELKEEIIELLS